MKINIEWVAPWVHGGPWNDYMWHKIRHSYSLPDGKIYVIRGIWIAGLCCKSSTSRGFGFHFGAIL